MPDEELTDFLAKASNVSGVLDATPSYLRPLDTFDALWPAQQSTGLNLVDLDSFWGLLGRGAYGVQVAVMDSGVNVNNDLSGSVMAGRNFIPGDPLDDTHDDLGHGTAVSSIIAAHSDNGFGISGIAPGVRIVPIKACDAWGPSMFPACSDAAIKDGLDWVMSEVLSGRQIRVLNMSLGGPSPVFGADFFLQTLHDLGVVEVASAGNDGLAPIVRPARSQ